MIALEPHPFAKIFPLIEGPDFDALVEDVRTNGLVDPIDTYEGMILDGRNRSRACGEAGVERHYRAFRGDRDAALAYVISKNLKRRHLDESQRALAAARIAKLGQGARTDISPIGEKSQAERARIMNIGKRSVERADDVVEKAQPEIVRAVEIGKLAISAAHQASKLAPETQRKIADEAMAGRQNVVRNTIKQESRAAKEADLGSRQRALPDAKYGVIYADPEWCFETYSESGMDRSADNHYPTSDILDIINRPVSKIAAVDCVLFLWGTVPMLTQAIRVMQGWGFAYKSHVIWRKDRAGTGYWFRNEHELLLVGTRGTIPAPAMGTQFPSVIDAPLGEHSAKPDVFYELIERYFPSLPKIELNARRARPGWDAWGNEAPAEHVDPVTGEITEIEAVRGAGVTIPRESGGQPFAACVGVASLVDGGEKTPAFLMRAG